MSGNHVLTIFIFSLYISGAAPCGAEEGEDVHRAVPVGAYGGRMNPDVSAVVNLWGLFSDNEENPLRNRIHIRETEIDFQAYLYPNVHGDIVIAMHEHDGEWHVHPEEVFISFLDLPFGFQFLAGRKLIDFGCLNAVHPHDWKFADQPLVLDNLFGDHPLFEDGAQADWLLPNPWNLYCKIAFGHWTGETAGHEHEHEGEEEHDHMSNMLQWQGKMYNGRAAVDQPVGELSNLLIGYSIIWDEGYHTILHGADMTLTYRRPMSYKRIKWQSELFYAKTGDEHVSNPLGIYSMLALMWNQYWELGGRYDWSEFINEKHEQEEREEEHHPTQDHEWQITGFLTYYFTHSLCLRCEYSYSINRFELEENRIIAQIVWGLGPHAHMLED